MGFTVQTYHIHIDAIIAFEICARKQMTHHTLDIDATRFQFKHDTTGILMIRFIMDIDDPWQFFIGHELGNLLLNLIARDLIGQRINNDKILFFRVNMEGCSHLVAATPCFIQCLQVFFTGDDFSRRRQIRSWYRLGQLLN